MTKNEKFIEKNQESVNEFIKLVKQHGDNLRCVIISPELKAGLESFEELSIYWTCNQGVGFAKIEDSKRMRLLVEPYMPPGTLQLVLRGENEVNTFQIPCVCGIYGGHKHP